MKTSFSVRPRGVRESSGGTDKQISPLSPFQSRQFLILLVAVTMVQAVFSGFLAAGKPLELDELNTLAVCKLPSWSAIWQADLNHADAMPPLYHYLEGLALRLPMRAEIALRVPSILGFSLVIPSLFAFVGRPLGARIGAVAACLPLVTRAYWYSYEARNYALTLGLTAVALFFWQKTQDEPKGFVCPIVLALALVAASATNYNAVYGFFPFFVAESVSALRQRRINWPILAALMSALIPYGFHWAIMSAFRQYNGAGFWSKPSLGLVVESVSSWADESTAAFIFLLITIGASIVLLFGKPRVREDGLRPTMPAEEWALCIGFCALPAIVFVVSSALKGGMVPRYSICMVIGVSLLVAYAMPSFRPATSITVVACAIAAFGMLAPWHLKGGIDPGRSAWKQHALLQRSLDGKTAIVIADGWYAELAYYSSPEAHGELFYIANPTQALRYLHTNTIDLAMPILARYLPLQVKSLEDFAALHHDFLLYAGHWNWLTPYLAQSGASMELIGENEDAALYRVSLPQSEVPLKSAITRGERISMASVSH